MAQLVSILIPAYNAEKWISDTINSSLNQTWPKKEIIIVDDGSTDNTLQIARQFESKSVKVISQENMGACVARNKALSFAQGDYIQWLDADDLLAPDKISQQLKNAGDGRNSRILLSSAWCRFHYRHQNAKFIPNPLWRDLTPVDWITTKFNENVFMIVQTWLVSRKLTELAGPWDERLSRDQDGEYICRVVMNSEKIVFVRDAKCYYRIADLSSVSNNTSYEAAKSSLLAARLCINYLMSLEDNERTRGASVKLLEDILIYFYPDKLDLIQEANDLSCELGGNLSLPRERSFYLIIRRIFGSNVAKKVQMFIRHSRHFMRLHRDRLNIK